MKTTIIIPARYQSRRFPGKPLAQLRGAGGQAKTLIRRSWESAMETPGISRVVIATDDARIADHAHGFGASVLMTPASARNGTERCAAALKYIEPVDLVINFQGDAPLTPPEFVAAIVQAMALGDADMATPVLRCDRGALAQLREDRRAGRVGGTTAVFDARGRALYFSKEVVPYGGGTDAAPVFHHVGLYAYRPSALRQYANWPQGPLERSEGLEQMRFLENGTFVRCVELDPKGRFFGEVNNPVDIERVEQALQEAGVE